jgi:hypothetical protein
MQRAKDGDKIGESLVNESRVEERIEERLRPLVDQF